MTDRQSPATATTQPAPAARTDASSVPDGGSLVGDVRVAIGAISPFQLASRLAYSLVFALPSIVLIVVLLAAHLEGVTGLSAVALLRQVADRLVPAEIRGPIETLLGSAMSRATRAVPTISALATAVVALWAAGGGIYELGVTCAQVSGKADERPVWRRRLAATVAALVLAVLLVAAFIAMLFGLSLWVTVTAWLFGSPVSGATLHLFRVGSGLVLVFVAVLVLYRAALGWNPSWRDLAVGAAAATLAWVVATEGFGVYVTISDPGSAYGAASGLFMLLSFIWASSLILIFGATLATVLQHRPRIRPLFRSAPGASAPVEAPRDLATERPALGTRPEPTADA